MFGCELVPDQRVADHVKRMLEGRGIEFNELNRGQAMVPACCTVLFNAHGTAPGMWFERDGKVVVSLPGVPYEMEHLMQDEVMPRLKAHFELRQIIHRTMITAGLPESMLAAKIEAWENALPSYLKLAYLPNPGAVRLRLSAYEVEGESVSKEIERQFEALRKIIPHNIIGYETATMQELVHKLLTERGLTLATAESCTGGNIAARFTAMPGASAYFLCGVVSYSNASKHDILGVDPEVIARHGAVSEEVARRMAEGARRISGADYAIATTGIAGPAAAPPKSRSARYGSPWRPHTGRPPSSNSAVPTAGRSSTGPAPSPSACCATNSTVNNTFVPCIEYLPQPSVHSSPSHPACVSSPRSGCINS